MNTPDDKDHYRKVKAVAEAALDIEATQRDDWLAQRCAGDDALRQHAQRWLAAVSAAEAEDFLDAAPVPPRSFGSDTRQRYRVLRELGHGGMGTVYLAERADGEFHQLVALKTLNAVGGAAAALAQRLRAERQILAGLQHAHIARLLDGGTDAAGWPWLVMEYVDGERIDRWCDARALTLRERIALFLPVCDAVAYAHQQLVVHRDIKPGNLLVTAQGVPKLLDFGIARLLADESTATATADQLLTFRYASPEQIRGDTVGTASDLYSLAVVLYRLLTGQFPYALDDASAAELARAALDDTPRTPSRSLTARSDAQRGEVQALSRQLSGDIDAILLRALRKQPLERYASVAQFADDLRRHLAGQPVTARQGQRGYALKSFLRRHRWGVAVSVLALAGLLGFTAALTLQLERTAQERDRANEVARFFAAMFEDSNPMTEIAGSSGARAAITVREVLDREAPRIERDLTGLPAVQATLLGSIGRVYIGLDQRETAERYLTLALARLDALDPADSREKAQLWQSLCEVRGVGGRDSTVAACARALDLALRVGDDDLALARTRRAYGIGLRLIGRYDDAQAQHDQAFAAFERLQQPQWAALTRGELAELAYLRGDPARCLALIDAALVPLTAQLGSGNALRYGLLSTRAQCRLGSGDVAGAETDLREALALVEQSVGSGAPVGNRGQLLNDLGLVLNHAGRFAESEPLLRESLAIAEKVYGPSHPELAPVLGSLSQALDGQGQVEEGIKLLQRAADLSARHQGDERRMHAIMLNNLGFRLLRERRYADAEPILREALAVYVALDPQHPDRAATLVNLGTLLLETGTPRDALPLLREGLALREKHMQPGSWQIETARNVLGACLVALGEQAEGRALLQSSYDRLLALFGPQHRRTQDAKKRLDASSP